MRFGNSLRRLSLIVGLLGILTASLSGCGGGGGGSSASTSPFSVQIAWPASTRAIVAESAVITLKNADVSGSDIRFNAERNPTQKGAYSQTYPSPTSAKQGTWALTVQFYDQPAAAGNLTGTAQTTLAVGAGSSGTATVSASGTVSAVTISSGQTVKVGQSQNLLFSVTDANGVAVAVGPTALTLAVVSGQNALQVSGTQIQGLAAGTASVTVTADGVTSAASNITVTSSGGNFNRDVCLANPHVSGRARWTVLVYINGANNLQPDSLLNVAQMAKVGSDAANVNIIVQWKQHNCADCGTPSFIGTRRYRIQQHTTAEVAKICTSLSDSSTCTTGSNAGDTTVLASDRLPDPAENVAVTTAGTGVTDTALDPNGRANGTVDMGSYLTLQKFVQWGAKAYPADHLAVLIWDHGSGWQPYYHNTRAASRAVSQDNQTQNDINTQEIPLALANPPQKVDMLILDCSLEQMVEVAYEVRNSARVMVGSEESPPGAGYPYQAWLTDLKTSGLNPCDVGNSIINRTVANYPNEDNITQSMLDLSKLDGVATALDAFAGSLKAHISDNAALIASARDTAQAYKYADNKDFYHFTSLILTGTGTVSGTTASDLRTAATNVQNTLVGDTGAIIVSAHGALGQAHSNGLAIYIPTVANFLPSYGDLAIGRATRWGQFLQAQTR